MCKSTTTPLPNLYVPEDLQAGPESSGEEQALTQWPPPKKLPDLFHRLHFPSQQAEDSIQNHEAAHLGPWPGAQK